MTVKRLQEAAMEYPDAAKDIAAWTVIVKHARWTSSGYAPRWLLVRMDFTGHGLPLLLIPALLNLCVAGLIGRLYAARP